MDWPLFVLKKVVSLVFCPAIVALILCLAGLIVWRRNSSSRIGPRCVTAGGIVLLAALLYLSPAVLMFPLERAAGDPADPADLARRGVRSIIVLGGGVRHGSMGTPSLPASESLARVVEGVRLWKGIPGARLILSGGRYSDDAVATADAMAWAAKLLGVPDDALVLEDKSWDTDDEARYVQPIVGREPFALVTSAVHMKRALLTFKLNGLDPVPAPTDFLIRGVGFDYRLLMPSSVNIVQTKAGLHEYAGLAWLMMKGAVLGRNHR